jgi:hypothetical protein
MGCPMCEQNCWDHWPETSTDIPKIVNHRVELQREHCLSCQVLYQHLKLLQHWRMSRAISLQKPHAKLSGHKYSPAPSYSWRGKLCKSVQLYSGVVYELMTKDLASIWFWVWLQMLFDDHIDINMIKRAILQVNRNFKPSRCRNPVGESHVQEAGTHLAYLSIVISSKISWLYRSYGLPRRWLEATIVSISRSGQCGWTPSCFSITYFQRPSSNLKQLCFLRFVLDSSQRGQFCTRISILCYTGKLK